jgi:hypothetical protein
MRSHKTKPYGCAWLTVGLVYWEETRTRIDLILQASNGLRGLPRTPNPGSDSVE